MVLSYSAYTLVAKTSAEDSAAYLPLPVHLADTAAVARNLWNKWLPEGTRAAICSGLSDGRQGEKLFVFLAAAHDIGKATPAFFAKCMAALPPEERDFLTARLEAAGLGMYAYSAFPAAGKTPHAISGQALLQRAGCNRNAAVIVGAHHGKPPDQPADELISAYSKNFNLNQQSKGAWQAVQQEYAYYALKLAGFSSMKEVPSPNMAAQVLLSGLLIMADWIASNTAFFPYIPLENTGEGLGEEARAGLAWNTLRLPIPWEAGNEWMNSDLYSMRFGFRANAIQAAVTKAAENMPEPGILVLEAPMGCGKTEAALAAAEIFANRFGRSGVFFALPTQATSNGIFDRIRSWAETQSLQVAHAVMLAHGMARFHSGYDSMFQGSANIQEEESGTFVHAWFEGRKKALLADFAVGTIDQLLLAALKQKHVMLRHLGLANKVVIIDECHAYDAYMSQYLLMALKWLSVYRVPVIILSATLPASKRAALIDAYRYPQGKAPRGKEEDAWRVCRDYPLITCGYPKDVKHGTVAQEGQPRRVMLSYLGEEELCAELEDMLCEGGCAGVIVNTVGDAQRLAGLLRERFGQEQVALFHSRFIMPDRAKKEEALLERLGKPAPGRKREGTFIVVGTQVLEQSLDIDFDALFTQLCPMDLLLQRIGRLHRHQRSRPARLKEARCILLTGENGEISKGSIAVYGEYLLLRTRALLPQSLLLPTDISPLVQAVYENDPIPAPEPEGYRAAADAWALKLMKKENAAQSFRVSAPQLGPAQSMMKWLSTDVRVSDPRAEAAVRDSNPSIDVLVMRRISGEEIGFLSWVEHGRAVPAGVTPSPGDARLIASQRVSLPAPFCFSADRAGRTIAELEAATLSQAAAWQSSPWLKGELLLILDEEGGASLSGYRVRYSENDGLTYVKEEDGIGEKGV